MTVLQNRTRHPNGTLRLLPKRHGPVTFWLVMFFFSGLSPQLQLGPLSKSQLYAAQAATRSAVVSEAQRPNVILILAQVFHDGEYFPDLMAAEAIRFVEANRQRPFLLYWALNTPHYPLQGTAKWRAHYSHLESPRREYAAFVSTTDEIIGRLLQHLQELQLDHNTIVVFQADHGHSTEERTFGGGGSAGPYRGAKFSVFEGGIRVPAMIAWPGRIPAGEVRSQLAIGCDWLLTLTTLCKLQGDLPEFDGQNLSDVLKSADASSPHKAFHWESGGPKHKRQWAVRKGPWKLIAHPQDTSHKGPLTSKDDRFLVNLNDAVDEMQNIADHHPNVVRELEALHDQWVLQLRRHQDK